jgi:hypothetical protein
VCSLFRGLESSKVQLHWHWHQAGLVVTTTKSAMSVTAQRDGRSHGEIAWIFPFLQQSFWSSRNAELAELNVDKFANIKNF